MGDGCTRRRDGYGHPQEATGLQTRQRRGIAFEAKHWAAEGMAGRPIKHSGEIRFVFEAAKIPTVWQSLSEGTAWRSLFARNWWTFVQSGAHWAHSSASYRHSGVRRCESASWVGSNDRRHGNLASITAGFAAYAWQAERNMCLDPPMQVLYGVASANASVHRVRVH